MTNIIQASDTATDFAPVLKKRWLVAPVETTSINLDRVVKHRSESDASKQANSTASLLLTSSDVIEQMFRDVLAYQQALGMDVLQVIENTSKTSYFGSTDSSTPIQEYYSRHVDARPVKNEVERLFSLATFITLDPGMDNAFSEGLEDVIQHHGEQALQVIEDVILNEETKSAIAMEALQYVGNAESNTWLEARRSMLERCLLKSRSAWVRDGAGLGLASLDDPRSIPVLKKAISKERSRALKSDLTLVLEQLQATLQES